MTGAGGDDRLKNVYGDSVHNAFHHGADVIDTMVSALIETH